MEKLRTEFVNTKEKVKDVAAGLVAAAIIGITFPIRLVLAGGRKIVAFVKNNKVKTLIFALVAIIIVLAVLLVNALRNPKIEEKVVTEYVEVVKEVIVEVPVEAETEESDKTTSSSKHRIYWCNINRC